ncbi:1,4-alpha-glucan-branching enzyme, partial [bacterium]|nr:1,4-alpha-glucan-branching enzyme [bacterium]
MAVDPWLEPYSAAIGDRTARFKERLAEFGPLLEFATSHQRLGLHREGNDWVFREWAPRAKALFLTGGFCGWSRKDYPLRRLPEQGVWEVKVAGNALRHGDLYKVHIAGVNGAHDRIPSHATFVVQDEETKEFSAQVQDSSEYSWENTAPAAVQHPKVYEAHVGMATEDFRVGTYREFAEQVLP